MSALLPFLLEIGTEEIPDWMIPAALESLRVLFEKPLDIAHDSVTLDATPRRLVLRAEGLPARQADSEERALGPAKSAKPQAVAGFARKHGVAPEALTVESTPKGDYYTFVRTCDRPGHARRSRRVARRHHPATQFSQDHVLDRQERPALHPAHPLDRGAAGRGGCAVRTGWRALRRGHLRPPPAGRARDRRHQRRLRTSACATTT